MIKRIFITFLGLFVGYNLFLMLVKPSWGEYTQRDRNINKVEQVGLDDQPDWDVVIVGSSIAARLNILKDKKVLNLSLEGEGALTGLGILKQSGLKPALIAIETNALYLAQDQGVMDVNEFAWRNAIKQYLPALQNKNKPSVLVSPLIFYQGKAQKVYQGVANGLKAALPDKPIKSSPQVGRRGDHQNAKSKIDHLKLDTILLKKYLDYFEKAKVKVVFFNMPAGCLEAHQHMEKSVRQSFQKSILIPSVDCSAYATTDGVHLNAKESAKYSSYLTQHLASYLK
ncbi:MAG TPA: hypothetical protein DCS93_07495 [Microscillaceae bacterium]|nr:hypothetical protein [Microscillaceae bacterium]